MFAIVLLVALTSSASYARDSRIVNGEDASKGEFPHQASLQARACTKYGSPCFLGTCFGPCVAYGSFSHICGAALVHPNWFVTAAHCVDGQSSLQLVVGLHDRSQVSQATVVEADKVVMHEDYESGSGAFPNDIALIKTNKDMPKEYVVQMANSDDTFTGQTCDISGWGRLSGSGNLPNVLQKTHGVILSNDACSSDHWGTNINDGHICIHNDQTGSCNGDSGGPLTCGNKLAGVTSWGRSGCDVTYPSVYSRISHFREWIDTTMAKN